MSNRLGLETLSVPLFTNCYKFFTKQLFIAFDSRLCSNERFAFNFFLSSVLLIVPLVIVARTQNQPYSHLGFHIRLFQ